MLKPGEIRILKALEGGPLGNVALAEPANLKNSTIRSKYLRNLLKQGLISRDIDPPRNYKLIARGWEMLFLIDLLNLIKDRVGVASEKKKDESLKDVGIAWWQFSPIISKDPSIPGLVMRYITRGSEEGSETRWALSKVLNLVDLVWRRKVLEAFSIEERKTIEDYMEELSDASWLLHGDGEEEKRIARDRAGEVAEQRLARRYLGIKIPQEIVQVETITQYEGVMSRQRRIVASLCPDVEEVKKALATMEQIPSIRTELNELVTYLEEKDRRNLYEQYLEKIRLCPKSLIISPSYAFREYQKKHQDLFSEGTPLSGF